MQKAIEFYREKYGTLTNDETLEIMLYIITIKSNGGLYGKKNKYRGKRKELL